MVGIDCYTLNYGIGLCRTRTVVGRFVSGKCRRNRFSRVYSICVVGAYAIASADSSGDGGVIQRTIGEGPGTMITMVKYSDRLLFGSCTGVPNISVMLKADGERGLFAVMRGVLGRGGGRGVLSRASCGSVAGCRRLGIRECGGEAEKFMGVRSNYSGFYDCYAVPCSHNPMEDHSPRGIVRRVRRLASRKVGRVILDNVGANTCKGSLGGFAFSRVLSGVIGRIGNLNEVEISSVRTARVGSSLLGMVGRGGRRFYVRFRVPLRNKYGGALTEVGHGCSVSCCQRGVGSVEGVFPSIGVAASVLTNFDNRAGRSFLSSCRFVGRVGFKRVRVFPCSPHPLAGTCGFPSGVSRVAGGCHIGRLLALGGRVTLGCHRGFFGRMISILIREGGGNGTFKRASGCLRMRFCSGGTRSGSVMGIGVRDVNCPVYGKDIIGIWELWVWELRWWES